MLLSQFLKPRRLNHAVAPAVAVVTAFMVVPAGVDQGFGVARDGAVDRVGVRPLAWGLVWLQALSL